MTCKHDYRKFDEVSLFCRHCGERRVIATSPTYWYAPSYPYFTWSTPFYTVSGTIGGSPTITSGSSETDGCDD